MSYVSPVEVVAEMIAVGRSKLACGSGNVLLRAALAGGILSLAVSLAVATSVQLDGKIYGAFVFPAGFVILILLGLDLVTGNFAVAPLPLLHGDPLPPGSVLKNWALVFCGNLIGCCLVAGLVAASMTMGFSGARSPEADAIQAIAVAKTRDYAALGGSGLIAVVARAILCNWMVTLGVVMGSLYHPSTKAPRRLNWGATNLAVGPPLPDKPLKWVAAACDSDRPRASPSTVWQPHDELLLPITRSPRCQSFLFPPTDQGMPADQSTA